MQDDKLIQEYIENTQEMLSKTAAAHEKFTPTIVDKLIALGLVKAASKQAAISSLRSPELVLNTLNSLLDSSLASREVKPVSALGGPVKTASKIAEPEEKESEKVWKRQFLINK